MLAESQDPEESSSNVVRFPNNEFYTAIMDEDLGRLEDMSKKYGSNFLIKISAAPGPVLWKGLVTRPLHLAASYRRAKSMQILLATGADPEMRDQLGQTALHLALSGWPSVWTTRPKNGSKFQTAVVGVRRRAEACLRLLFEHGIDPNAKAEGSHQSPLHLSVRYMALSAVPILASFGADVNAVESSGMTPLHMAAGILHKDIMASLIKEGADVNMAVKHSGNSPLHLAAVAIAMKTTKTLEDDVGCICELLERGAEVDAVNEAGLTPLQEACRMGHGVLVDVLLRYGADIKRPSKAGENCLFLFLNHRPNERNRSLLVKLLSLTSPLTVYNKSGHLPSTLMQPCFFYQRDQLLKLTQQPRRLQDICKSDIYLEYVQGKSQELRERLPDKLHDFVFNDWEKNISFVRDGANQDHVDDLFDMS
ncbi:ankyrin repeat domain-containing protein 61-like [Pungitius pungitius]|uniref:ankyrin repeat domain-containing protein 61-like n=1 Tax=Pungitius pungitius TaxID=134920 RepID=UPI002E0DC7FE